MREFYIEDIGIKLHAKLDMPEKKEKCPLILIIHGFTGHMEETHIVAAAEAAVEVGFAALRVEMYGHGMSGGKFEDHNLFKWISNVLAAIDYAKSLDFVTDLYITGHSQGGLLAILAAGLRPKTFKALIPLSPALCIPDTARKGSLLGREFDVDNVPDELDLGDRKLKGDYLGIAQMIHAEELIRKYHGPVLLIHGDADDAVPVEYSIEAAKLYDHAKLVIIPGDTHCYDHHLDQVIAAFKEFLLQFIQAQ